MYSDDHSEKAGTPQQVARQDCMRDTEAQCSDYHQGWMIMLAETTVKHTRTFYHSRYNPDHSGKTALPALLAAAAAASGGGGVFLFHYRLQAWREGE